MTFDHKPGEISDKTSSIARDYVDEDAFRSPHFKISELIARQAGILQLEGEAQQDKINAQVLEKLKEVQEKAYEEGHQLGMIEGTEKAFQEMKAELVERMKSMESMLKRIEVLKKQLLIDNEAGLIKLVFEIAKKIAFRDLEQHHDAVKEIMTSVVGEAQADETVVVRLAPKDIAFLEELQAKAGERIEGLERVKMIPQENVKSGGCLIETEFGSVNATVEERVDRIWQTLQGRVPQKIEPKTEE